MNSKNPNPGSPVCTRAPDTSRLEPDPINVVEPPSTATKLSPIIILPTGRPSFSARAWTMGMKITTTGMLFMKALTTSTVTMTTAMDRAALPRPMPRTSSAPCSSTPVRTMPWPTTSSASTVIRAGLAKPDMSVAASSRLAPSGPGTGTRWNMTSSTQITPIEVTSMGTRSDV